MPSKPGELREAIWAKLLKAHVAVYPLPPHGHHPNFMGAGAAAGRLLEHLLTEGLVQAGDRVLSYPDYVLRPLRKGLLEQGVTVVVPAKYGDGYRLLEPTKVNPKQAVSIAGAEREGELLAVLPDVSLACIACVALGAHGDVLGKGYGFSLPDELAELPTVTLVHPLQRVTEAFTSNLKVQVAATPDELVVFEKRD